MSKFTAKNAVVWVWSEFFPPGTCDEAPPKLQEYFDNGYVVKDIRKIISHKIKTDKLPSFLLKNDLYYNLLH